MAERDYSGDVLPPNNLPAVAQEYLRALEKRIGVADSRARRVWGNLGRISGTQQAALEQIAQERAERESATSDIVGAGPTKAPSTPLVFSAKGSVVVHWDGKAYDDTPMPTSLAFTVPQYSLTEPPAYEPPPPADPVTGQEPSPPSDSVVWQPVGQPLRAAGDAAIPDIPTGTHIWVRLQAYTLGGVASYPSDWVEVEVESIAVADLDPEVMDRIEDAEATLGELGTDLATARDDLAQLSDSLADAEEAVSDVQAAVDTVQTDLANARGELTQLVGTVSEVEGVAGTAAANASAALVAATGAEATANDAKATADAKPLLLFGTTTPSGTAPQGSTWFHVDALGRIIGQWQQAATGIGDTWASRPITNSVIANLDAGKITTGTLAASRIAAGSITAEKIAGLAITADKLAALSVTAEKIAAEAVTAEKITAGAIGTDHLAANAVTAEKIVAGSLTGNLFAAHTISAREMVIGDSTNLLADPNFTQPLGVIWKAAQGASIETIPEVGRAYTVVGASSQDMPGNAVVMAMAPGDRLTFRCRYQSDEGVDAVLRLQYTDIDGNLGATGTFVLPGGVVDTAQSWTDASVSFAVPATVPVLVTVNGQQEMQDRPVAGAVLQVLNLGTGAFRLARPQLLRAVDGSLIVNGAIDGKVITGATVRTASSGRRVVIGQGTPAIWLYDSNDVTRGYLQVNEQGGYPILSFADAAGNIRSRFTDEGLWFYNAAGTRVAHMGISGVSDTGAQMQFYGSGPAGNNPVFTIGPNGTDEYRLTLNGADTGNRLAIFERTPSDPGIRIWGGADSRGWALFEVLATTDGARVRSSAVQSRTTTAGANVYVASDGTIARSTSVKAAKLDVADQPMNLGVLKIPYRSWTDKQAQIDAILGVTDVPTDRTIGAVAEEVEQVAPELITRDPDGRVTGVAYDRVGVALIPIIRHLLNRIEVLEGREPTVWPESPTYDDTALWDEVLAYGAADPVSPPADAPVDKNEEDA